MIPWLWTYRANATHFDILYVLSKVQQMSYLLIQYEALKYFSFGLIVLKKPVLACFALSRSRKAAERDTVKCGSSATPNQYDVPKP